MRILHLMSSGGMYGAERMLLGLAGEQRRLGCEPILGVFQNESHPHLEVADEAKKRGLSVEIFSCRGRFDYSTVRRIRRSIKANSIDLIHGHGYKSNLYGYLSAKRLGIPLVSTCHLWTASSASIRLYEFLDSFVLRRAQRVVGVSEAITQCLRKAGVSPARLSTIDNGTELADYSGATSTLRQELGIGNRPLIGTVGRLEEQKGIEYLVRAAGPVLAEFPTALFVIVGEGSLHARIASLVHDLGLDASIRIVGRRDDMPGVYASMDLFALASIDEGMPMTILEALAAGRPVVATKVGAVEKLVIHQQTGLLVEPRDPAALADAILRCLRDPEFARELGRKGQEHVRGSFSAEEMARRYLEIYGQMIRETHTDPAVRLQET